MNNRDKEQAMDDGVKKKCVEVLAFALKDHKRKHKARKEGDCSLTREAINDQYDCRWRMVVEAAANDSMVEIAKLAHKLLGDEPNIGVSPDYIHEQRMIGFHKDVFPGGSWTGDE